jgi:hypothetical protein
MSMACLTVTCTLQWLAAYSGVTKLRARNVHETHDAGSLKL